MSITIDAHEARILLSSMAWVIAHRAAETLKNTTPLPAAELEESVARMADIARSIRENERS